MITKFEFSPTDIPLSPELTIFKFFAINFDSIKSIPSLPESRIFLLEILMLSEILYQWRRI